MPRIGRPAITPAFGRSDSRAAHQPRDSLSRAPFSPPPQLAMNPRRAISPAVLLVNLPDDLKKFPVPFGMNALGTLFPGIVPAARDRKRAADQRDRELLPVLVNELIALGFRGPGYPAGGRAK